MAEYRLIELDNGEVAVYQKELPCMASPPHDFVDQWVLVHVVEGGFESARNYIDTKCFYGGPAEEFITAS